MANDLFAGKVLLDLRDDVGGLFGVACAALGDDNGVGVVGEAVGFELGLLRGLGWLRWGD